jgi:hypothetical protein
MNAARTLIYSTLTKVLWWIDAANIFVLSELWSVKKERVVLSGFDMFSI